MIEIKNINLSFKKTLFEKLDVKIGKGITVITGTSGTGKSTLLEIIARKYHCYESYTVNNHEIADEELRYNTYYGRQNPDFEENLTIEENLALIQDVYQIPRNRELENELLEIMGLDEGRDLYIPMLSGGEKKRLYLIMAVISKRSIVLLDEPTASVDGDMAQNMLKVIHQYLKDRITIITTHDMDMLNIADYTVDISSSICALHDDASCNIESVNCGKVDKYYFKTMKHKRFYTVFTYMLAALIACMTCIGLNSSNTFLDDYQKELDRTATNEIIVYEPLIEGETYTGDEYPLSSDDIQTLENLSYIKSMRELFYYADMGNTAVHYNNEDIELDDYMTFLSCDNTVNDNYLSKKFSDSGIYISSSLEEYIGEVNKGDKLSFKLMVPVYNVFNDGYIMDENNQPLTYIVYPKGQYVDVTMDIAGVVKDDTDKMGMSVPSGNYTLYLPHDVIMNYVEEYKVNDEYKVGNKEFKPYAPNAYAVTLQNIGDFDTFKEDMKKLNLALCSQYVDSDAYIQQTQSVLKTKRMMTSGIVGVLLVVMIIVKKTKRKEESEFFSYLNRLTANKSSVMNAYYTVSACRAVISCLISLILLLVVYAVSLMMKVNIVAVDMMTVLLLAAACLIIEGLSRFFLDLGE